MIALPRLHAITDTVLQDRFDHPALAARMVEGGADAVQFREKRRGAAVASALCATLTAVGTRALVVVNDRIDLAGSCGARSVHLGRLDGSVAMARRYLGPDAVVGRTANGEQEARDVALERPDYLGVGPVYGTASKANPAPRLGLEALARICAASPLPVIAIGSIHPDRVAELFDAGVWGIAVLSGIALSPDPASATARYREALDGAVARHLRLAAEPAP